MSRVKVEMERLLFVYEFLIVNRPSRGHGLMVNTARCIKHFADRAFTVFRGAAVNRSNYTAC